MKKRVVLCLALVFCVLLSSCNFEASPGKSAYEIACDNGFVGTEQEWLLSLQGTNGTNGRDGENGVVLDIYDLYDAYLVDNPNSSFEDFINTFLDIEYSDTEYAASKSIMSIVRLRTKFQGRSGWQTVSYYAEGSGVVYKIVDNTTYIITNYHVIYDYSSLNADKLADEILVYFYGFSNSINASFIGGSISNDIAILSIDSSQMPSFVTPITASDSNDLTIGSRAIAIGNPLAEGIAVTSGVISVDSETIEMEALNSPSSGITMRVIRIDTPINSGNSGGGLFNARGELIGIINAKTVSTGVESIGYAIPSNVAIGIANAVIENQGKKCLIGISTTAVTTSVFYNSSTNRIEVVEEIKIVEITSGGLADGVLEVDDIILSAQINDGEILEITRSFHLSDFLYKARLGDTLTLNIERNDSSESIILTPAETNFISL